MKLKVISIISGVLFLNPAYATDIKMQTSLGDITLELYDDKAPVTVKNFLTYIKDRHFDGAIFHRVIKNFMIQGGGFDKDYNRLNTRPPIKNEADNGLKNKRGTIAMARTNDPHSATAQFFINTKDNTALNHKRKSPHGWGYAVFGKVIKGMEVVNKIENLKTGKAGPFAKDVPQTYVIINNVSIQE